MRRHRVKRPAAALLVLFATSAALGQTAMAATPPPFTEFTNLVGRSTWPDTRNARIYETTWSASADSETVVRGRRPAARYFSFAALDGERSELASINDKQIRTGRGGGFEIVVRRSCSGVPNCLAVGAAEPAQLYYRIYLPEGDGCGGVGVPSVAYRPLTQERKAAAPSRRCPPRPRGVDSRLADLAPQAGDVPAGAVGEPPSVLRFDAGSESGTGGTQDNAYVYSFYDITKGNVEVTARAPTYRVQHRRRANRLARSDGSEQVRYWSVCSTAFTRPIDCIRDEEMPLGRRGHFNVIVSPSCPVRGFAACLRSGPNVFEGPVRDLLGDGAWSGFGNAVIARNLLAGRRFANRAGPARCPAGRPSQFCGAYALRIEYLPRPTSGGTE